jgi:hypothetical protein
VLTISVLTVRRIWPGPVFAVMVLIAAVLAQWPVRGELFPVTLSRITAFVAATLAAAADHCSWHDGWLAPIYEVDRGSSYTVSATGSIPEPKRAVTQERPRQNRLFSAA